MALDEIKDLLRELEFPENHVTDQTALIILALADRQPRSGLISGHRCLAEGARIHDILEFVRHEAGRRVAENTRESYRKTSLRPLAQAGWVIRHQLSTNDPNTYYCLNEELARLLAASGQEREELLGRLRGTSRRTRRRQPSIADVVVQVAAGRRFPLSPGEHNGLEKEVVEVLAPAVLGTPQVVYLGDTAPRAGYQNRTLMRSLNLPIDLTESLPDVILYNSGERRLLVVEVVTSSGPINPGRLDQLQEVTRGPARLNIETEYLTAFPSRRIFRRFVEEIAWGTAVWIADEPWNLIHFEKLEDPEQA